LLLLDLSYVAQIHCGDAPSRRRNSESQRSSISASWRRAHCKRLGYQRALRAVCVEYTIVTWSWWLTWLLVAISFVTVWSVPALVNSVWCPFNKGVIKLNCCCWCFFVMRPLFSSSFSNSIALQIGRGIAQWFTGMFAFSHFSL
jgi:hypothetical protein